MFSANQAQAPQTPPSVRIPLGGGFTFGSPSTEARTVTIARRALFGLGSSASGPAPSFGSPTGSVATTLGSPALSSSSSAAALDSPALSVASSGSSAFTNPFQRLSLAGNNAAPAYTTFPTRLTFAEDTGIAAAASAGSTPSVSRMSDAPLSLIGSPRRRNEDLLSPATRQRTEQTPRYAEALFIKNAKTNEALFKYGDFSIEVDGRTIDVTGFKKIGSGHFSNVYEATSKENLNQKFVLRFFKETPGEGPLGLMSPVRKDPNIKAKDTLRYLGNQFARYVKIQSNAFLAEHHVKFHTFDTLIEKAKNNTLLLNAIKDLLAEPGEAARISFAMNHLRDGYIIAEHVTTSSPRLNYETVSLIKTLYDALDVTLDPHLANWSQDGRMLDIYEDEHDDKHAEDRLSKAVSPEIYQQFFAKPANLTALHKTRTPWGDLLYSSDNEVGAAAANSDASAAVEEKPVQ